MVNNVINVFLPTSLSPKICNFSRVMASAERPQKGRWRKDKRKPAEEAPKIEKFQSGGINEVKIDSLKAHGNTAKASSPLGELDAGFSNYTRQNAAAKYALKGLHKNRMFLAHGMASDAIAKAMQGGSIYLPNFFAASDDFSIFYLLVKELAEKGKLSEASGEVKGTSDDLDDASKESPDDAQAGNLADQAVQGPYHSSSAVPEIPPDLNIDEGLVKWSKHAKYENPDFSQEFRRILSVLAEYFDVEIFASRLNFYGDGSSWKPFHHDSHAYDKGHKQTEDFTMGASFGSSRQLVFLHEETGQTFSFPQNNGDIFAFTSDVNDAFKHGVPMIPKRKAGPRFSIIAWGKRLSLTSRNSGLYEAH